MTLADYNARVDALRESRRSPTWEPSQDREALESIEDVYASLSPAEQAIVDREGWRGWPDLYDARMR